jgi:hypothetical protein
MQGPVPPPRLVDGQEGVYEPESLSAASDLHGVPEGTEVQ